MLTLIMLAVAAVVFVVLYGVKLYNDFVKVRNLIQESWRQVDAELNLRYDWIPNFVETIKAYGVCEHDALDQIISLRAQAASLAQQTEGALSEQRAEIEQQLSTAIRDFLASTKAYPDLKSNENFLNLQQEAILTEDRIAAARRYYNATVREYIVAAESFPSNIVAKMGRFGQAAYFEVSEKVVRQAPRVGPSAAGTQREAQAIEPTNEQLSIEQPQSTDDTPKDSNPL